MFKHVLSVKKIKPKTPTDEFVSIRIYYDDELILGYEIIEEGDVCTERPVTCNWMDYVPRVLGSEKRRFSVHKNK